MIDMSKTCELYESDIATLTWEIKDFFYTNEKKKAIIGISGGIDSTLVAHLCTRALGVENVFGVLMPMGVPELYQESLTDGLEVVKSLGINYSVTWLNRPYNRLREELKVEDTSKYDKILNGNIQARLRMITLYHFAGKMNGLVVGTTNLSEYWLGYCTKYGDSGVDFEPIQNLYKTDVFNIAKLLRNPSVPEKIINKKPSACLWQGQSDEEELGLTYEEIDKFLSAVKNDSGLKFSPFEFGLTKEKINKILKLIDNSAHKKKMPPTLLL